MQASMQAAFLWAICAEVGPAAVSIGYRTILKQPQNPAQVLLCEPAGLFTLLTPALEGGAALYSLVLRCVSGPAD